MQKFKHLSALLVAASLFFLSATGAQALSPIEHLLIVNNAVEFLQGATPVVIGNIDAQNGILAPTYQGVIDALNYTPANKAGEAFIGNVSVGGNFALTNVGSLDTTYANTPLSMANVIEFSDGNLVSYCPQFSCLSPQNGGAPTNDHQRTSALFSATTTLDNQAEEQTVAIETTINSGYRKNWAANTSYARNANVAANSAVYRQVSGSTCTSGSTAPSNYGNASQQQTDGSCVWQWINAAQIAGKLGLYLETAMNGNAGFSEGLVTNFQIQSAQYATNGLAADPLQGAVGIEHDFKNNAADCVPGTTANCHGMDIDMSGAFKSTLGILINGGTGSHNGTDAAAYWGIQIVSKAASEFDLDLGDNAKSSIGIGVDGFNIVNRPNTPSIRDGSTSSISYQAEGTFNSGFAATGTFASAGFIVNPTSALIGFQCYGNKITNSCFNDGSSAPVSIQIGGSHQDAIDFSGTFQNYYINAVNFHVTPAGYVQAVIFGETLTTPASSLAPCIAGQFTDDASYHYVCVATNTWKRVALSTF